MKNQLQLSVLGLGALLAAWLNCLQNAEAQSAGIEVSRDKKTNEVIFVRNVRKGAPLTAVRKTQVSAIEAATEFVQAYGVHFGISDPPGELSLNTQQKDDLGMTHLRFAQRYKQVPVFGAELIVHLNKDLTPSSAGGRIISKISLNPKPDVTKRSAARTAKRQWRKQFGAVRPEVRKIHLFVFNRGLIQNKREPRSRLVWQVQLTQSVAAANEYYYIDAHRGKLMFQLTGRRAELQRRVYDCGAGGSCYLDQTVRLFSPPLVLGRSEGSPERPLHPAPFSDSYTGINATNSLYDLLGYAFNYYREKHGRDGCNSAGGIGDGSAGGGFYPGEEFPYPADSVTGLTYVDYYRQLTDFCPNAMFDGERAIWLCEGLVTADIVGHEYSHALIYYTIPNAYGEPAGLIYAGESGALNEAYADIFGNAIENHVENGAGDWLMGEDSTIGPLRDMSSPGAYSSGFGPMPDRFNSPYVYCGPVDSSHDYGGVHHNMSIPAYAAYLIAAGGSFNNCQITGLGREKEDRIFYRALNQYYGENTTFNYAFNALIAACLDLGYSDFDCRQVTKALKAVEMDQGGYCSGEPAQDPGCAALDNPGQPTPEPTVPADLRAPVIAITAPSRGQTVRAAQVITFNDSELTRPRCSINARSWVDCISGVTKVGQLPGWNRVNRKFGIYIYDIDTAGNQGRTVVSGFKKKLTRRRKK